MPHEFPAPLPTSSAVFTPEKYPDSKLDISLQLEWNYCLHTAVCQLLDVLRDDCGLSDEHHALKSKLSMVHIT